MSNFTVRYELCKVSKCIQYFCGKPVDFLTGIVHNKETFLCTFCMQNKNSSVTDHFREREPSFRQNFQRIDVKSIRMHVKEGIVSLSV